jgi:hypothetical protein
MKTILDTLTAISVCGLIAVFTFWVGVFVVIIVDGV